LGTLAGIISCPFCHEAKPVVCRGTIGVAPQDAAARTATRSLRLNPISEKQPRKRSRGSSAREERLSIEATAQLLNVAKKTIHKGAQKKKRRPWSRA